MKKNIRMYLGQPDVKSYVIAGVFFLLLSCGVIGKALLLDKCYAYDTNDDINHIFTGLYTAKQLLMSGAMPFMNYYNNFGTPLMGDALTYPFALQSIPYYLTDIAHYPLVATINKFVLCFLTLSALLAYYRMFNFSIFTATIVAVCVFFNFPHFWFFAHHHYQATMIFTVTIFIAQKTAIRRDASRQMFVAVAILFGLMIYSVSANLIVLCTPFFLLHPLLLRPTRKVVVANIAALFAGGVIGGIQVITTAVAAVNSARVGTSFSDDFILKYSWSELMLKLLYYVQFSRVQFCHISVVTYFSMILILAYGGGLYLLYKNKKTDELTTTIVLGLVPSLPICLMLVHTELWKALPILKSTDITRILWISMIFIGVGIGYFIEASLKKAVSNYLILGMIAMQSAATLFAVYLRADKLILFGYMSSLLLVIVIAIYNRIPVTLKPADVAMRFVVSAVMVVAVLLTYFPIVNFVGGWERPDQCTSWNYFSDRFNIQQFSPIAERMQPTGRFALNERSLMGLELQLEIFGRHGGGGRSIMINGPLHDQLISRNVIANDDPHNVYHFENPWDTAIANRLGLRYFGTPTLEHHDNWELIGQWEYFYVYENMQAPTLVSLRYERNNGINVETFEVVGNDLRVNLPPIGRASKLIVAMTARPGFLVKVDGVSRAFKIDDFGFFNINVSATDKLVELSYNPLNLGWLL